MASARDLITIFVALETISIPTFILAAYRKHDRISNEAGVKYYLIGVLSSALMLYGMSLIFGYHRLDAALRHLGVRHSPKAPSRCSTVAIFLSLVGFAFKVSAVPFHFWAPDTYEGAPTPVTAFLSVASKAGGFVALLNIIFFGFYGDERRRRRRCGGRAVWVLAAASMTLGNLGALRQTNIVRMLAYSSIAQGGFMLVPFAAAGIAAAERRPRRRRRRVRRGRHLPAHLRRDEPRRVRGGHRGRAAHRSRPRSSSYDGLFQTSPGLAVMMTIFLASLAGIPPLAGWFAKFVMFSSIARGRHTAGRSIARGDRGGQLGDRVLLLRRTSIRADVVQRAGDASDRSRDPRPARARRRDRASPSRSPSSIGIYPQLFARVGELAF